LFVAVLERATVMSATCADEVITPLAVHLAAFKTTRINVTVL
jgi:hypothetical protein